MKEKITYLLALILVLAAVAGALVWGPDSLVKPVSEKTAGASRVNEVDFYFPANPSTGYAWTAEIADEQIVGVREQLFEEDMEAGLVGVGTTDWFHLYGKAPGTTSVTFRYARSWEESAESSTTYRLTVDEDLNVLIWGVEAA